jgi:restriction endonuclease S subunit
MSDLISLNDFISNQIAGDWGKEKEDNRNNLKVYCIRGADINAVNEGSYTNLPIRYIESKNKLKILKEGNIIIEISGGSPSQSTGRVCYIRSFLPNIICSNFCRAYEIKNEHSPKFFYYLIKNIYNSDVFFNFESKTSGIKNLLIESALDNIKVPKYNLPTQQSIAKVLSDLDYKIELNNKINKELESMAKTLYDYWFVQFDFPNEEGKPYKSSGGKMVYNEELKREIPEGWEVKKLLEITDVSNESINPMLTPEKVFKHYSIPTFDESGTYGIENGAEIHSNKFLVNEFDILVSKLNPWFNRVIYSLNEENLICSTEFVVWRTTNLQNKNYLYLLATSQQFITYCTQSATGTSNSHKRVNPNVMMRYKNPYNARIVQEFGIVIDSWIKTSITKQKENKYLSQLRDWLLPMLMNGQVTVKDVEHK